LCKCGIACGLELTTLAHKLLNLQRMGHVGRCSQTTPALLRVDPLLQSCNPAPSAAVSIPSKNLTHQACHTALSMHIAATWMRARGSRSTCTAWPWRPRHDDAPAQQRVP
jgi:hypothetical protein